jgi:hypothetical protein
MQGLRDVTAIAALLALDLFYVFLVVLILPCEGVEGARPLAGDLKVAPRTLVLLPFRERA